MIKLNIQNINIKTYNDFYIYIFNLINDKILIKEINTLTKEIYFIEIENEVIKIFNNQKNNLLELEKNNLIERIIKNFKNNNIIKDILDIDKLARILKNIIISNDTLALTKIIDNKIDVILLEKNCYIGSIIFSNDNIDINVNKEYLKNTLELLEDLIKKNINKKNYNIKILTYK